MRLIEKASIGLAVFLAEKESALSYDFFVVAVFDASDFFVESPEVPELNFFFFLIDDQVPFPVVLVVQKFDQVIPNPDNPGVADVVVDENDVAIPFPINLG